MEVSEWSLQTLTPFSPIKSRWKTPNQPTIWSVVTVGHCSPSHPVYYHLLSSWLCSLSFWGFTLGWSPLAALFDGGVLLSSSGVAMCIGEVPLTSCCPHLSFGRAWPPALRRHVFHAHTDILWLHIVVDCVEHPGWMVAAFAQSLWRLAPYRHQSITVRTRRWGRSFRIRRGYIRMFGAAVISICGLFVRRSGHGSGSAPPMVGLA